MIELIKTFKEFESGILAIRKRYKSFVDSPAYSDLLRQKLFYGSSVRSISQDPVVRIETSNTNLTLTRRYGLLGASDHPQVDVPEVDTSSIDKDVSDLLNSLDCDYIFDVY